MDHIASIFLKAVFHKFYLVHFECFECYNIFVCNANFAYFQLLQLIGVFFVGLKKLELRAATIPLERLIFVLYNKWFSLLWKEIANRKLLKFSKLNCKGALFLKLQGCCLYIVTTKTFLLRRLIQIYVFTSRWTTIRTISRKRLIGWFAVTDN